MSDGEKQLLQEAASQIGSWQQIKDNQVYGYNTTEKSFIAELNTIKALSQRALFEAQSGSGVLPPEDTAQIDTLYNQEVNPADFY